MIDNYVAVKAGETWNASEVRNPFRKGRRNRQPTGLRVVFHVIHWSMRENDRGFGLANNRSDFRQIFGVVKNVQVVTDGRVESRTQELSRALGFGKANGGGLVAVGDLRTTISISEIAIVNLPAQILESQESTCGDELDIIRMGEESKDGWHEVDSKVGNKGRSIVSRGEIVISNYGIALKWGTWNRCNCRPVHAGRRSRASWPLVPKLEIGNERTQIVDFAERCPIPQPKRQSLSGLTNRQTSKWLNLGFNLADRSTYSNRFSPPNHDLLESIEVPRLSIIVPHLHDDSGLELTLLSILENRESDFEILIAHNGRYNDPYSLDQEEAILVASDSHASFSEQLNLAVASACSPIIQVLLPGSIVDPHWCDESLYLLNDKTVSAVCQPIGDIVSNDIYVGLSSDSLPHRRIACLEQSVAAPLLCGGVFRKRLLKSVEGWLVPCQREIAEVEFALLVSALEIEIEVARDVTIRAPKRTAVGNEAGYEIGRVCGQLACAYASIEGSGVVIDSLARRLGHLASGLMSPKSVAERLGWVMGIRDRTLVGTIQSRLETASAAMELEGVTIPMNGSIYRAVQHRAA